MAFEPNKKLFEEGGIFGPKDAWDKLSIAEKAEMMKVAIKNGTYDLPTIRKKYNEFAEGGSVVDNSLAANVEREEGFNTKPKNIGDGKITLGSGLTASKWHDLYRKRGNRWSQADNRAAVLEELRNREAWAIKNIPNWNKLPDSSKQALLSYKYNYDFNRGNSPKLFKALENFNLEEAARQMDTTSKDPKFKKGLMARRQREQQWFLRDVHPFNPEEDLNQRIVEPAISTDFVNPFVPQVENTMLAPQVVPNRDNYVRAHQLTEAEDRINKFNERMEAISNFNKLMRLIAPQNNEVESYQSTSPLIDYISTLGNTNASGGKIHIKPENRGKFTALKKRTGHSATWFKEHGTPAQKKMAVFALNARKWKHGEGGNLFSGEENHSQQVQLGPRYWADQTIYHDWQNSTIDGGTLPEVIVSPTNDASWLFSTGKYVHNPRKPLADKHTRKVVSDYLSKFDDESAKEYNERISRLADVLDIRGVQFKKNNVKSGKLKGRAHYIDQSATAYIDSMEDIFAEVAHPWQYAKGNNNIEEEVGTEKYDSDSDPRGGTRYAYPDTAEGETHAFFEPVLTEWIETGKIGKSSPILNNELSRQKIKPKNRMEVGDSASSWNRQAIERRLLANPSQLPLHKRIQYGLFDYPLLDKKKHGDGGDMGVTYGQPFYSYDDSGKLILDEWGKPVLNYNASPFPEIVVIPDSKKSPAQRNADEKARQRNLNDYAEHKSIEWTDKQVIQAQRDWENSAEKKALDYAQAATTGIGIGADIVSGLPIYSSLKGASTLSRAETPLEYIEGGLWLTPMLGGTYQGIKPIFKTASKPVNPNNLFEAIQYNAETPEATGRLSETQQAAEKGRNKLLEWIQSPFYKQRLEEEPFYRFSNDIANEASTIVKDAPLDFSKTVREIDPSGNIAGTTKTRPALKVRDDGYRVFDLNTGLDVNIGSDLGNEAEDTTLHELLHYLTVNSNGIRESTSTMQIVDKGWMHPLEALYNPVGKNILRGKKWQNYILDQNDALLPKYDSVVDMVMNRPDEAKAALLKAGRTEAQADVAIKSLQDRYAYWADIQEQRAHLQELFISKIKPHLKNPNDAVEIESFLSQHPEILENSAPYNYIQEVRPGSLKQYAGYFASALSTLPFINKLTTNEQ